MLFRKDLLKYLVITTAERIKLQAQAFDGKIQCWAPDAKEGFVTADIQSTKGDEVSVKTSKGEVKNRIRSTISII